MRARVQRWGNSLALRIPRSFAVEAKLHQDTVVDLSLVNGKLVVQPILTPEVTLEQLLAQITEANVHGEVDSGPPVGQEIG
jgi:antitoxin MazE